MVFVGKTVQANCDHALNANLLVQQLSDGPKLGVSVVVCLFVHDDVHYLVGRELVLNERHELPEFICDSIEQVERVPTALGAAVPTHEVVGEQVSSIVDHGGVYGHLGQPSLDLCVVVRDERPLELATEGERFADGVDEDQLVGGEVLQGAAFATAGLSVN